MSAIPGRLIRSRPAVAIASAVLTATIIGGVAWATQSPIDSNASATVHACYNAKTGAMHLNVTGSCPKTGQSTPIAWPTQSLVARVRLLVTAAPGQTWSTYFDQAGASQGSCAGPSFPILDATQTTVIGCAFTVPVGSQFDVATTFTPASWPAPCGPPPPGGANECLFTVTGDTDISVTQP